MRLRSGQFSTAACSQIALPVASRTVIPRPMPLVQPSVYVTAERYGRTAMVLASPLSVTMKWIPAGVRSLLVENCRIDQARGNVYTEWKEMGSPQDHKTKQNAKLRSEEGVQFPTAPDWVDVKDGAIHLAPQLPTESVSLLARCW